MWRRAFVALFALVLLSGCDALSLIPGSSGPRVNTNAQLGETNSQTVGETRVTEQSVETADTVEQSSEDNQVRSDAVTNQTNHFGLPWWAWLVIGVFVPSHREIAAMIRGDLKRSQKKSQGP